MRVIFCSLQLSKKGNTVQAATLPESRTFSQEEVLSIEVFKRGTPPCSFCIQAIQFIRSRFPKAELSEYDMQLNPEKWKQFNLAGIKTVPQITFILKEGKKRVLIGGFAELLHAIGKN